MRLHCGAHPTRMALPNLTLQGYGSGGKAPSLPTICIKEKVRRGRFLGRLQVWQACKPRAAQAGAPLWLPNVSAACHTTQQALAALDLLSRLQDLGCAPGKSASGKGCTSCPTGKKLKAIKPLFLPGSDAIQLTPLGKACY